MKAQKKRVMTAAGRNNIRLAQKRRWADAKAKAAGAPVESTPAEKSAAARTPVGAGPEKTVRQHVEDLIEGLNVKERPIMTEIQQLETRMRLLRAESEKIGNEKDVLSDTLKRLVDAEQSDRSNLATRQFVAEAAE